ncbi:N-6 DNA methylase [Roseovarius sp. SK2]|uniref:N-6 DNA methylase n=1 Tax=Roseovarius TaxID=74030 RepID=UPI001476221C|nr:MULTISPECIES: N-6 DNA methylase [Roseovarius]MDD9727609.1 N-6 DNA methylase [Roseovarius sp. SK2]
MKDDFYTPTALARDLVRLSVQRDPRIIADFAVGDGALLLEARKRWPQAQLHGLDLDPEAIARAQDSLPGLKAITSDYLSSAARAANHDLQGRIDLVLLNPPFTCRGSSFETTEFGDNLVKSSKAMAFLLRSCSYLSANGEILAIVPRSCLYSQKDGQARENLSNGYNVDDLGVYESPGFSRASVSVHLVRISKRAALVSDQASQNSNVDKITPKHPYSLVFMRGSHAVADGVFHTQGPSLIHTTDLFNYEISISRRRATRKNKLVSGKVLMLPRVARPNVEKVAVGSFIQPVVPSDCIVCVKTVPGGFEEHLHEQICRFWDALEDAYSGTCASYLTLDAFREFSAKLGYKAEFSNDHRLWNPDASGDCLDGENSAKAEL